MRKIVLGIACGVLFASCGPKIAASMATDQPDGTEILDCTISTRYYRPDDGTLTERYDPIHALEFNFNKIRLRTKRLGYVSYDGQKRPKQKYVKVFVKKSELDSLEKSMSK